MPLKNNPLIREQDEAKVQDLFVGKEIDAQTQSGMTSDFLLLTCM